MFAIQFKITRHVKRQKRKTMNRNRPKGDLHIWPPETDLKITVIIMLLIHKERIKETNCGPQDRRDR